MIFSISISSRIACCAMALAAVVAMASTAGASGPFKTAKVTDAKTLRGTYTLYIMRVDSGSGYAHAAVLDLEGDAITISPATSQHDLKTYKGLSAARALRISAKAFATHCAYDGYDIKRLTVRGRTAAIEIIPNYNMAFTCDAFPFITLTYFDKGKGVIRAVMKNVNRKVDFIKNRKRPPMP